MGSSLGLDHPLIAVKNMASAREAYGSLGFTVSPQGMHPWGTATSLMLFHRQIIEIVAIGDCSLLDGYPAGDFIFGRHVERYLNECDGVALSALYTGDAQAVETELTARRISCSGTINFGRDVVRSDGQADRTKTTLKVFTNTKYPRLSVFACQQHRRDLLEFPHLMEHANGAHGIDAVTIACSESDSTAVLQWLIGLHGGQFEVGLDGEWLVRTANGFWRVCVPEMLIRRFGSVDTGRLIQWGPRIVGVDIRVESDKKIQACLKHKQTVRIDDAFVLNDDHLYGGVMLRFVEKPSITVPA